jgi:GxxExxY protein
MKIKANDNFVYEKETYRIIGSAQEVHKELGSGFLEMVYHDALELEFTKMKIPYKREFPIPVYYKNKKMDRNHSADFFCYGSIILEIKAVKTLTDTHQSQVFHYLKATGQRLGLLINFGEPSLKVKRIIFG